MRLLRCGFGDHLATSKRPRFSPVRIWQPFRDLKTTPFFRRPFRDLKTTPVLAPGISRPTLFFAGFFEHTGPPSGRLGQKYGKIRVHPRAGSGKNTGPPSGRLGQKYGSTLGPARAKIRVHPRAGSGIFWVRPLGAPSGGGRGGRGRSVDFSGLPALTSPFPGFPSMAPFCAPRSGPGAHVRVGVWFFISRNSICFLGFFGECVFTGCFLK